MFPSDPISNMESLKRCQQLTLKDGCKGDQGPLTLKCPTTPQPCLSLWNNNIGCIPIWKNFIRETSSYPNMSPAACSLRVSTT